MALRDLDVGINFDDFNLNALTGIDNLIDDIITNFRNLDSSISGSSTEFGNMGNDATDALNDITTEAEDATDALDDLTDEAQNAGDQGSDALDDLENSADNANDAAEDLENQMHDTGKATNVLGGSIKKLIGVVAAFVAVDKIKDLGMSMIQSAADAQAQTAQFSTVFGDLEGAALKSLDSVGEQTNVMSGRLKGSFLGIAAFAKTGGMDTADALAMTERATIAAADGAAFYDKSIEEVSESLQSFLKGNFANDAALGISATETTRNAAANKLYGKSFNKLAEDQKQMTLLQMVEDGNKLTGALGQAAREGDGFENVVGNLKQSWTELMAKSGDKLLEPVVKVLQGMTGALLGFDPTPVINFLEKGVQYGGVAKDILMGVVDSVVALATGTGDVSAIWEALGVPPAIAADLEAIGGVLRDVVIEGLNMAKEGFDVVKDAMAWAVENYDLLKFGAIAFIGALAGFRILTGINTAMGIANTLMIAYQTGTLRATFAAWGLNTALLANPLTWVAVAIGVVIAIGVLLYQNWDTVKLKAGELWVKTKEVFGGIFDWGKSKIQPVVDIFKGLGDKFSDFKNKITNFKLPDWVTNVGDKIGGAVSKLNGSHATGLYNVPFDGYTAELHKNEAILTAQQSDALRAAGILTNSGGKPKVNMDQSGGGGPVVGGGGGGFSPQITVQVFGGNGDPQTIAQMAAAAARKEIEKFWRQMTAQQG